MCTVSRADPEAALTVKMTPGGANELTGWCVAPGRRSPRQLAAVHLSAGLLTAQQSGDPSMRHFLQYFL